MYWQEGAYVIIVTISMLVSGPSDGASSTKNRVTRRCSAIASGLLRGRHFISIQTLLYASVCFCCCLRASGQTPYVRDTSGSLRHRKMTSTPIYHRLPCETIVCMDETSKRRCCRALHGVSKWMTTHHSFSMVRKLRRAHHFPSTPPRLMSSYSCRFPGPPRYVFLCSLCWRMTATFTVDMDIRKATTARWVRFTTQLAVEDYKDTSQCRMYLFPTSVSALRLLPCMYMLRTCTVCIVHLVELHAQ